MISVKRNSIIPPKILTENGLSGLKEQAKAIKFYSLSKNSEGKFPYSVYSHEDIKVAFNELFHKKCAYCESQYYKVQPVDVEHYRPKGGVIVNDKLQKPGYYWLGSDWDNLLPSCIDCNRQRTHRIDEDEGELLGKANLFPIINEGERALKPGYEFYEKRLLLDPCRDKVEEHLLFHEDGNVEGLSFMGMVSIETYGLRRPGLIEARKKLAKQIIKEIATINFILAQVDKIIIKPDMDEIIEEHFEQLNLEIKHLIQYMDNDQEYSALARQIIKPFLKSFNERLQQLEH